MATVVLTNEDGVNLIGPLSQQIAALLIDPDHAAAEKQDREVRSILEGLQQSRVDRSLFTENANSYFSEIALSDYRNSLAPLGKLEFLSRQSDTLRVACGTSVIARTSRRTPLL